MSRESDEIFKAKMKRILEVNERHSKEIQDEADARRRRLRKALAGPMKRFRGA